MKKENVKREIMVIEGRYKLVEVALDWQVYIFNPGGEEVRMPGTGEMVISKPRWVPVQAYFSRASHLHQAVLHISRMALDEGIAEGADLQKIVEQYKEIAKQIEETAKNELPK